MSLGWLDGLCASEQGFLLASLLFSSRESDSLFRLVDPALAEEFAARAKSVVSIERNKRVALLVAELKRQLVLSGEPWILGVHPTWLAERFSHESEAMKRCILSSLPKHYARDLSSLWQMDLEEEAVTKPRASAILWAIDQAFVPLCAESVGSKLRLSHLSTLSWYEIDAVVKALGSVVLVSLLEQLGDGKDRALADLNEEERKQLVQLVKTGDLSWPASPTPERDWSDLLSESRIANKLLSRAGLSSLAQGTLALSEWDAQRLAQRMPFEGGAWFLEQRKLFADHALQLTNEPSVILNLVIELSKLQIIDERFSRCVIEL